MERDDDDSTLVGTRTGYAVEFIRPDDDAGATLASLLGTHQGHRAAEAGDVCNSCDGGGRLLYVDGGPFCERCL